MDEEIELSDKGGRKKTAKREEEKKGEKERDEAEEACRVSPLSTLVC